MVRKAYLDRVHQLIKEGDFFCGKNVKDERRVLIGSLQHGAPHRIGQTGNAVNEIVAHFGGVDVQTLLVKDDLAHFVRFAHEQFGHVGKESLVVAEAFDQHQVAQSVDCAALDLGRVVVAHRWHYCHDPRLLVAGQVLNATVTIQ